MTDTAARKKPDSLCKCITIAYVIFCLWKKRKKQQKINKNGQRAYCGTLIKGGFAITAESIWIFHG